MTVSAASRGRDLPALSGLLCAVVFIGGLAGLARRSETGVGWRHRAACRGEDPDLFYPVGTSELAESQVAAVKAVCARCVVRTPCLRWALHTEGHGIWGGTTPDERRLLRTNARRWKGQT